MQKAAYLWLKSEPSRYNLVVSNDIGVSHVQPLLKPSFNASIVQQLTRRYHNFDFFDKQFFGAYIVTFNYAQWKLSTCTCGLFLKKYVCKHIFGLAALHSLVTFPLSAKSVKLTLAKKKKKGRPPNAIRQPLTRQ